MKLKKLILAGFKSFADRTEFDFDDGISCVVGPNGCGKSNIVDAVKWVMGEQSAKSLRGSEMMDVIFSGSSTRKPSGMAEVTLVFDNSSGFLQPEIDGEKPDGTTISVTRRLYRNSQSDYLINKTPCRLKDVREMFMDTGLGRDAYSMIEQGRVSAFLQASDDERRAIFDEAAGISKYKSRKKETLRRLERVEQNLLRLEDILGEVLKRLRSIKYQAGKARNYQTYTQRLNEQRSLYFLAQYFKLSKQRMEQQQRLDACNDELTSITAMIDRLENSRSGTEVEQLDLERSARDLQARHADIGGKIIISQQRADMLASRVKELGEHAAVTAKRCEQLEAKLDEAEKELADRTKEQDEIDRQIAALSENFRSLREEHASSEMSLAHMNASLADEKAGTIDLLRRTAQLHNEVQANNIRCENLNGRKTRLSDRAGEIGRSLEELLTRRAKVESRLSDVQEVLSDSQAKLEETRLRDRRLLDSEQDIRFRLSEAREKRSAVISRTEALREMLERLEGVGEGVRNVIQASRSGQLPCVRGILGDFLDTDVEHAPVVEAALAGADQRLLATRFDDLAAAKDKLDEIIGERGAVEVMCLDRLEPLCVDMDVSACPHVLGRVIDRVRFDAWIAPAAWRVLGRTFVVRTLRDASSSAKVAPRGTRFVTLNGEVLEADGTVRFGAARKAAGVITRRSELAGLEEVKRGLEEKIVELQHLGKEARSEHEHLDQLLQSLRTAIYEANTERVEAQSRLSQLDEQVSTLRREQPVLESDLEDLAAQIDRVVRAEHDAKEKAAELERLNVTRQREVELLERKIAAARNRQGELSEKMTEAKVALAGAEEKRLAQRDALASLSRQCEQMRKDLATGREEIGLNRKRSQEAQAGIDASRTEIDGLYAAQQDLGREISEVEESRSGLKEKLEKIGEQLNENRTRQKQATDEVNSCRIELSQIDVRIENLLSRSSDEMGMDLLEQYKSYEHDDQRDWQAVENEIEELRGKIERLGNVNLDAITEQEELEQRREFLSSQLDDVKNSQKGLNDLIRKINHQSRELFLASFEKIRKNFQELFRKLFGGGKADIFLTDPQDVLSSGIEIYARPPGKELRSLTLLSGGEKTMTALAMLFSIFKSRPSPFCLLDEVDAALDENNNERFNRLLAEFVPTSQFLIISHAKRTMSMANVLYGVTMQEPGVSKRISVRFEDAGKKLDEQLEPVGV